MKKNIIMVVLAILSFVTFNLNTKALDESVPSSFVTGDVMLLPEYIPGIKIYSKPINEISSAYCEDYGKTYLTGFTMTLNGKVDDRYIYILDTPLKASAWQERYYIRSVAVWWFKDYLNGNDTNIPKSIKDYIKDNRNKNSICGEVYDLVEGAKKFKQEKGFIKIDTTGVEFLVVGDNYVSDEIKISALINKLDFLGLEGAPLGSKIIDNNLVDGNGTIRISVPVGAIEPGETAKIKIIARGTHSKKSAYDYKYTDPKWQQVIHGHTFTSEYTVSDEDVLNLTKPSNKLIINKIDGNKKHVSGASLALYKGDCINATCSNEYASWMTNTTKKEFNNIPVGKYTLVELKAPAGYKLARKMLVNITSDNGTFTYDMIDLKELSVKISKTDITGDKEIPGATLVVKDARGNTVKEWVSTNEPKLIVLDEGEYTLTETIAPKGYILSKTSISFKLDSDNNVYQKNENNEYQRVNHIKMVNLVKEAININKLDLDTNEFVSGATLTIKNNKGETISTWVTTEKSKYLELDEGEYTLTEVEAPNGYVLNTEPINFKVTDTNDLYVKNTSGEYVKTNGIIMYNEQIPEIIEEVPKTGLTSTITYVIGTAMLALGSIVLFKNGKKC